MAREKAAVSTPLLQNICNQPEALRAVWEHFSGEGRASLLSAAKLLESRQRVVLSGMGASLFACIGFRYSLQQATALDSGELLYYLPEAIDADTSVILVSRSGESVEVLKLLPELRHRGVSIIGVVNVAASTLAAQSDTAIVLHSPADQMVAIQTYGATVTAFTLLAAALAGDLDAALADLDQAIEVLRQFVPECVAASQSWSAFLDSEAPLYLLGRGAALGSVEEGVLLMHETAKAPAVGMSAAQFRHGPVEVVDERFRAIVIGTQEKTRDLEAGLAEDLQAMGGQVRWIGPPAGNHVTSLCEWPVDLPERLGFLGELVPLQLAAYRKAEWNGVKPGEFRWAPLVTTTETGFAIPRPGRCR